MEQKELLRTLKTVIQGFSRLLGKDTEIVLHDLTKKELIYIVNGNITGRQAGYKINPKLYDAVLSLSDTEDYVVGYVTHSATGKKLRASHITLRDDQGEPRALICINQDISKWEEIQGYINNMIKYAPLDGYEKLESEDKNYIQKLTKRIILDTIEKAKPYSLDTKETKMEVLKKLEIKGIFSVKDAVPIICKMLSISQATLYNYLRELRNNNTI